MAKPGSTRDLLKDTTPKSVWDQDMNHSVLNILSVLAVNDEHSCCKWNLVVVVVLFWIHFCLQSENFPAYLPLH